MSGADWDLISELLQFPNSSAEILAEHKQRQRAAAHDKVDDVPAAPAKPSASSRKRNTAALAKPTATDSAHAVSDSAHVASAPQPGAPVVPPDPVTLLLQALDNATDDAERERLLQAAPYEVRAALDTYLGYHALMGECAREVEAQDKSFTSFTAALDSCGADESRVALIQAAQPAFLAEWSWRQTASDDSWVKRYLAVIGADKGG